MPAGLPTLPAAPSVPAKAAASARAGAGEASGAVAQGAAGVPERDSTADVALRDAGGGDFALLLGAPLPQVPSIPPATPGPARDTGGEAADGDTTSTVLPGQLLAMLGLAIAPAADAAHTPAAPADAPTVAAQAMPHLAPTPGQGAANPATAPALPPPVAAAAATAATPVATQAPDPGSFATLAAALAPARHETATLPDAGARGVDAIATLASTLPAATADTSRPAPPPTLPATLAQPADPGAGYGDEFGANLAWMAERRLGHAEIRLNPEHLGPIDVRVQLEGDRVHAEFHTAHADVRQALEASLPRLRDLLGQHGLQLAQADVGQRRGDGQSSTAQRQAGHHDPEGESSAAPQAPIHRARGLLDEYA